MDKLFVLRMRKREKPAPKKRRYDTLIKRPPALHRRPMIRFAGKCLSERAELLDGLCLRQGGTGLHRVRKDGDGVAVGADILRRSAAAVDIGLAHCGFSAEGHRHGYADILADGKYAGAVADAFTGHPTGSDHRGPAALGGSGPGLRKGRHCNRNAYRSRLVTNSGTSLDPVYTISNHIIKH